MKQNMYSLNDLLEIEKNLQLRNNIITLYKDCFKKVNSHHLSILQKYMINETEYIVVEILCGNGASYIQNHLINNQKPNQLEEAFTNILDNVLEKLPKNSNEILLRYDTYGDIDTYSENTDITVNHYLTTTPTDLGNIANTKFIWEIKPLPSSKTNARCLYEIVPLHIQDEKQVNFKRNTKFHIDKIDKSNNIPILKVHEIE